MNYRSVFFSYLIASFVFLEISSAFGEGDLVDLLILRSPDRGLIQIKEMALVGLSKDLSHRVNNRISEFNDSVMNPSNVQLANFHRELYDFIIAERSHDSFDSHVIKLAGNWGHDSNVASFPSGEWMPSDQSSAYLGWGLGFNWQGRKAPWGQWALALNFDGQDFDRTTVSAYNYSQAGFGVLVDYESGWHWSLANDWLFYGAKGMGSLGDVFWDYHFGYGGETYAFWHAPIKWDAQLLLRSDRFKADPNVRDEERLLYGIEGSVVWEGHCRLGLWENTLRQTWLKSTGTVDLLDYRAIKTALAMKFKPVKSQCTLILGVQNEKRFSFDRLGSESNDSFWSCHGRLERPLWSENATGYLSATVKDVDSRYSAVTFHSEDVALGMEWIW